MKQRKSANERKVTLESKRLSEKPSGKELGRGKRKKLEEKGSIEKDIQCLAGLRGENPLIYKGMETIEKLDDKQRGGHTEDTKSVQRIAAVSRGPSTSVLVRTVGFVEMLNMTLM